MKHKRLNRDGWGFQGFPYYQLRVDSQDFHGMVCLIRILGGQHQYWNTPKAGKVAVCGEGMTWMQLIPDGKKRVITVKYFPDGTHGAERKNYPEPEDESYQASLWYVDVTDGITQAEDGTLVFIDKYLDVIFTPEGDVMVDDRDELDAAYASGELSKAQYEEALREGEEILEELTKDIAATQRMCAGIRHQVESCILAGEREKMLSYLENDKYGKWRTGETVTYQREDSGSGREGKIRIFVSKEGRQASFGVSYRLPEEPPKEEHCGKYPFFVCMHPIESAGTGLEKGYAFFFLNSLEIASDDCRREGVFYDLYPYTKEPEQQTGVLMAWAWGAAKVLDAVSAGLAKELQLDPEGSLVTGVSRWGKATAVLGVFDKRFRMVIPTCSGAAGLALYSVKSAGKSFDLTAAGGPTDYVYGENEPLSCLQSEAERGWFVDAFLNYREEKELPYDQDILPKLAAGGKRSYFIVAAWTGEDWVNAPSMYRNYLSCKAYYTGEHLENRIFAHFHKAGHAVLAEDLEAITGAFDELYYPQWWVEKYKLVKEYRKANETAEKGQTVFTGSSLMEMFPVEKFAEMSGCKTKVYNRGIGGYVTTQLEEVLDICVLDLKPGKVFINIGTNDLSNEEVSIAEVMSNYERILRKILREIPEVTIYLMAYYPINRNCAADAGMERTLTIRNNEKIREANREVKALAERLGGQPIPGKETAYPVFYIDVNEPLTDEDGNLKQEYCIDGMHITEEGYASVWPLIVPYLKEE